MAENILKKGLERKPEDHNVMWILANFYLWYGKYTEALGLLESLLRLKPDSRGVRLLLARVYFNLGQYENVARILSNSKVLSNKDKENYYLGDSLIELRRFKEGIEYLEKYTRRYSKDYLVFVRLGYAYYKEELYEDAIKAYQRAAILSPSKKEIQASINLCSEKLTERGVGHQGKGSFKGTPFR
jgi:tetratricopeptide (TPR) repeat protein